MDNASNIFLKWIAGVLLIAILAVIVSKNSSAAKVVQAFTAGFTNILATVVGPINSGAAQQAADSSTQAPASTTSTNAGSSQQSGTGTGTGTGGSAPVADTGTGAASATDSQNNTTTGH